MVDIYKVGGAVRDKLLGLPPTDNDYVVVGANKNYMLSRGFIEVGRDFPVYLHPQTREEYALARLERKTGIGHKAFAFETEETVTLADDLKRRDITINAMALDKNNKLIDPFNGYNDLQNKIIRHVSNSFSEDPLRVLRVARFSAKLNFEVAPETITLMKDIVKSQEILHLSRERIIEEIGKALLTKNIKNFFHILFEVGALEQILPQLNQIIKSNSKEFFTAISIFDKHKCNLEERFAIIAYYMHDSQYFNKKSNRMSYILINTITAIKNFKELNTEDVLSLINRFDPIRRKYDYLAIQKLFFLISEAIENKDIIKNIDVMNQIILKFTAIDYSKLEQNSDFLMKLKYLKLDIINNILAN